MPTAIVGSDTLGNLVARGRRVFAAQSRECRSRQGSRRSPESGGRRRRPVLGGRWFRNPPARTARRVTGRSPAFISSGRFRRIQMDSRREVVSTFAAKVGRRTIGNVAASGTAVIDRFGPEHRADRRSGFCIRPPTRSFRLRRTRTSCPWTSCTARATVAREMLVAPNDVSRVIARPFVGTPGAYNADQEPS